LIWFVWSIEPNQAEQPDKPNNQSNQMKLTRFEDLDCWKEARVLVRQAYNATREDSFKKELRLSGQVQAAATSIMGNIAEGFIRRSSKEFIQFLFVAISSASEVQGHLYVALDQGYIRKEEFELLYEQANKTARIISGLITYLRTKSTR
jgi:four helix bundle protein